MKGCLPQLVRKARKNVMTADSYGKVNTENKSHREDRQGKKEERSWKKFKR